MLGKLSRNVEKIGKKHENFCDESCFSLKILEVYVLFNGFIEEKFSKTVRGK